MVSKRQYVLPSSLPVLISKKHVLLPGGSLLLHVEDSSGYVKQFAVLNKLTLLKIFNCKIVYDSLKIAYGKTKTGPVNLLVLYHFNKIQIRYNDKHKTNMHVTLKGCVYITFHSLSICAICRLCYAI